MFENHGEHIAKNAEMSFFESININIFKTEGSVLIKMIVGLVFVIF